MTEWRRRKVFVLATFYLFLAFFVCTSWGTKLSNSFLLKQSEDPMQSPGDNNNPLPWAGNDTLGDLSNISISAGPFTTTSFFNNFDSFLVGLNIETWYNSSTECFEPIFFLIDDTYFLRANFTSENRTILGRVLNVTKVIATNFADILPNCIMFE